MNPADLPDELDAGPEYGLVLTLIFFAVYAVLIGGILIYLLRKLPRKGGPFSADDEGPQGPEPS